MLDFTKNISPTELIVIALILLLLFGRKVLVGLARSAGETLKEVKKVKSGLTDAIEEVHKPAKDEKGGSN
jgi:TatA/E family protein of Tat protein translocase